MSKKTQRLALGSFATLALVTGSCLTAPLALAEETETTTSATSSTATATTTTESAADEAEEVAAEESSTASSAASEESVSSSESVAATEAEEEPVEPGTATSTSNDVNIDFDALAAANEKKLSDAKAAYEAARKDCLEKADKALQAGGHDQAATAALLTCSFKIDVSNKSIDEQIERYNKALASVNKVLSTLKFAVYTYTAGEPLFYGHTAGEPLLVDDTKVVELKTAYEAAREDCLKKADAALTAGGHDQAAAAALLTCSFKVDPAGQPIEDQVERYTKALASVNKVLSALKFAVYDYTAGDPLFANCTLDSTDPNCAWAHGDPLFVDYAKGDPLFVDDSDQIDCVKWDDAAVAALRGAVDQGVDGAQAKYDAVVEACDVEVSPFEKYEWAKGDPLFVDDSDQIDCAKWDDAAVAALRGAVDQGVDGAQAKYDAVVEACDVEVSPFEKYEWAKGDPLFVDDSDQSATETTASAEQSAKAVDQKSSDKKAAAKKNKLAKTGSAAQLAGLAALLMSLAGGAVVLGRKLKA